MQNYFDKLDAKKQFDLEVEFDKPDISLDIPLDGVGVNVNEWRLISLTPSVSLYIANKNNYIILNIRIFYSNYNDRFLWKKWTYSMGRLYHA